MAPRSTQPFILPRSIKWVTGISGDLNWLLEVIPGLRQLNTIHKKSHKVFFYFFFHFFYILVIISCYYSEIKVIIQEAIFTFFGLVTATSFDFISLRGMQNANITSTIFGHIPISMIWIMWLSTQLCIILLMTLTYASQKKNNRY